MVGLAEIGLIDREVVLILGPGRGRTFSDRIDQHTPYRSALPTVMPCGNFTVPAYTSVMCSRT